MAFVNLVLYQISSWLLVIKQLISLKHSYSSNYSVAYSTFYCPKTFIVERTTHMVKNILIIITVSICSRKVMCNLIRSLCISNNYIFGIWQYPISHAERSSSNEFSFATLGIICKWIIQLSRFAFTNFLLWLERDDAVIKSAIYICENLIDSKKTRL